MALSLNNSQALEIRCVQGIQFWRREFTKTPASKKTISFPEKDYSMLGALWYKGF
jgi:hypothetical protein